MALLQAHLPHRLEHLPGRGEQAAAGVKAVVEAGPLHGQGFEGLGGQVQPGGGVVHPHGEGEDVPVGLPALQKEQAPAGEHLVHGGQGHLHVV